MNMILKFAFSGITSAAWITNHTVALSISGACVCIWFAFRKDSGQLMSEEFRNDYSEIYDSLSIIEEYLKEGCWERASPYFQEVRYLVSKHNLYHEFGDVITKIESESIDLNFDSH